jgi:2-polyprenyl-3-methyl-5-hydroxy-6-metoxy-1,4-benzoquinol methylase
LTYTATLKRAESYTFFRMVGALAGQRVLDLACGFGFYTRLLKQRGAAQVLGVDLSPEMIRLANREAHEWALKTAGFRTLTWYPSKVPPEDVAHYGEAYWRDFHDNCLVIGVICQK